MYMLLIFRADSLNVIKWWVDVLYAVHGDMRGHNGTSMSILCGSEISTLKKQKINTSHSMALELD